MKEVNKNIKHGEKNKNKVEMIVNHYVQYEEVVLLLILVVQHFVVLKREHPEVVQEHNQSQQVVHTVPLFLRMVSFIRGVLVSALLFFFFSFFILVFSFISPIIYFCQI
jgi:hypothetical protein